MSAPLAPLVDRWTPSLLPSSDTRVVVPQALRAFFLAGLAKRAGVPIVAVVASEREAEELADDLALFVETSALLPAWETLPFEHISPNLSTMANRAHARFKLQQGAKGTVIVTSVRAATQVVSPSPVAPLLLAAGATLGFTHVVDTLAGSGYERVHRVEGRGEFSVRGGIIDVYPAAAERPFRAEFWGDEIESLRGLNPGSQRSEDRLQSVAVFPAREFRSDEVTRARAKELAGTYLWAQATWDRLSEGIGFAGMESWMPWLVPQRSILSDGDFRAVLFDPVRCQARSMNLQDEEADLAEALAPTWGQGAPSADSTPPLYLDLEAIMSDADLLHAPPLAASPSDSVLKVGALDAEPGHAESLVPALGALVANGTQLVLAMDGPAAASRVGRQLSAAGFALTEKEDVSGRENALIGRGIHHGFVFGAAKVAVLGEQAIAGRRRAHRTTVPRARDTTAGFRDLTIGDYVVHHRHGIGRFDGLVTRTIAGVERDYLIVAYAGEDRLYVPTDQLAAVQKYSGGEAPRLSRMGGSDWAKTRGKVRQAVAAVAEHVVSLHRERSLVSGHAFASDTPWQQEMEGSFPFEETPDQLIAIEQMKRDMEGLRPMDRLIFGDVGFGKTEVAIRGAFKAVMGGKQVAVLCPTTLLAQQHFQTFSDRLEGYPIEVAMLSRFLTAKGRREVIEKLQTGEVDLVIGTHALLGESVSFKNLGLLVIDEEQRFGVAAKDSIRRASVGVDVLTLTATPIPRTLEMALTGIRDVSQLKTAPGERRPILTYVGPYDERSVAAAIRREMLREGQVFYVHNRVRSIDMAVAKLRELVPHARFAVAHGKMSEGQLEQTMLDFWRGEYDVLVATTIIESGLDLPTVNTLIVERSDMLGLAQLYQLRGRVGRSDKRAYAYLFHPEEQTLTETAYRRLQAIGEATELGAGFQLAQKDLEIRGAGSILGEVQSGHIAAVGFDLYVKLVSEAVSDLQGLPMQRPEIAEVRIELPVDAHLPESYVDDQLARLEAYRKLAVAGTAPAVDEVEAEWRERFGALPTEASVLINIARLRTEAIRVGLEEILALRNEVRLGPVDLSASQEVRLTRLEKRSVLNPSEGRIFLPKPDSDIVARLISFMQKMWPAEKD